MMNSSGIFPATISLKSFKKVLFLLHKSFIVVYNNSVTNKTIDYRKDD